jgi:CRISPR-associated endonuclease Cas1
VAKGFDPRVGFFHQPHGRHMTLASDLMEPLRHLVDRVVLAIIHRNELTPAHFKTVAIPSGLACRLDGQAFRIFIGAFERTLSSTFTPAGAKRTLSYNAYLDEAVDALRRSLTLHVPYAALRIR